MWAPRYTGALAGREVFLVSTPHQIARADLAPLGVPIAAPAIYSAIHAASGPFLERIQALDARCYRDPGLQMPKWAVYDCGELPGAIVGLGVRSPQGLDPIAMMIAIPMLSPDHWLVHTLCADGALPGGDADATRVVTLALGLATLGARRITGVTQWSSAELDSYAALAPLTVLAAHLPHHDRPDSLVVRAEIDPHQLELHLARTPPRAEGTAVDRHDDPKHRALQAEIEAGRAFAITGPGDGATIAVREVDRR